jgi:NADPH-dependent 2,4-dienoyl-CoA reductase/sulfur reductase-like enzyme/rhodanese-related sulfurtransferase
MTPKRILVVGGVAGGATCAARSRRVDESAEIVVFDRGPFVSFANCGLPYYVGDVIAKEQSLLVATPALFRDRFRIDVRTDSEVVAIDRKSAEIEVRELKTGRTYRESYDALVLAPGAAPVVPPLPGLDLPGVFTLRTIPDSKKIREWIAERKARTAVVVGAGFIGLEMVENFVHRGLAVTVIELADQVLPPLDPEMARTVADWLAAKGVTLLLGEGLAGIERATSGELRVKTNAGTVLPADVVLLGLGVRPETKLAVAAGLEIGQRGGIRVDEAMRTSDPRIWAIGDAVEVRDAVTKQWTVIPLAGPANRQGRVAADSIAGREACFRGVQGTAVCGVLGLTAAMTGASEKSLKRAGVKAFEKVYLHPGHHAGYYPGAKPLHMKLIFSIPDGVVLGAQAVGEEGVDKRIDVIAMAIQKGGTVRDLEEAELCYAPQYGSAKDPVNLLGMVAVNALSGDAPLARWDDIGKSDAFVLDVRQPEEFAAGHVEGAVNVPLPELRGRLGELPREREIWAYCRVGQRSYYATRLLRQHGLQVRNLTGGYQSYLASRARSEVPVEKPALP